MGSYDLVGYWDEHQWHSAGMDRKKLQQVKQLTTTGFAAEVDDKDDDGKVDRQSSDADYCHQRIPWAHSSSSSSPCVDGTSRQKR